MAFLSLPENPLYVLLTMSAVKMTSLLAIHRRRPREAEFVGEVSGLFLYPVKSCRSLAVDEAQCVYGGLRVNTNDGGDIKDRHFMVISENGNFVSQRKCPRMALIQLRVEDMLLHLVAPGMDKISVALEGPSGHSPVYDCKVWGESVDGLDCGEEVAVWLSTFLEIACRLVYSSRHTKKRELQTAGDTKWHKMAKDCDQVAFSDFAPYLLATDSSLSDLNTKLSRQIDMRHIRPNITISGSRPLDEDNWKYLYIGDTKFYNFKPCGRCRLTTVDPETGVMSPEGEPLKTLSTYRMLPEFDSPCFGVNLLLEFAGTIRVGDPVYVIRI